MLDLINLLTFLGAVQGIFFGLVLLRLGRGNRWANVFLALFLLNFSVSMLGVIVYSSQWVLKAPHLGLAHSPFGATLGGPFLLYILAQTQKNFRPRAWHWLLLCLPALIVLVWLLPFYALPAGDKRALLEASYTTMPTVWRQVFVFSNVVSFAFIVASYVLIARHERVIREIYSSPLHKTLAWTRHFLYAGLSIFVLCVLLSFYDFTWADTFSNLCFSAVIYVFGYRAIRQPDIFGDVGADAMPEESSLSLVHPQAGKYGKSGLSDAKARPLLERLDALMTGEKCYLDPSLNLPQLAARLGITPHQLSQLLNQFRGESFSDFVNGYRIAHFKNAAADPARAHLSLLALAFDSGFNSKAAFNAVFKKTTGLTPSDFVKKAAAAGAPQ